MLNQVARERQLRDIKVTTSHRAKEHFFQRHQHAGRIDAVDLDRLSGVLARKIEGFTDQPEELARVKALDLPRYNKCKAKMDQQAAKRAIWAAADAAQLEALKAKLLAGEAVSVPDKAIMQAVRDELNIGGAEMDPAVKAGL